MEKLSPGFACCFYPNLDFEAHNVRLLNILMGEDPDEFSLIDYFIYELDFGTELAALYWDQDDNRPLNSPEVLYDILVEQNFSAKNDKKIKND